MEVKKQSARLEDMVKNLKDIFSKGDYAKGTMNYVENTEGTTANYEYQLAGKEFSCSEFIDKNSLIKMAEKGRLTLQKKLGELSGKVNLEVTTNHMRGEDGRIRPGIRALAVYPAGLNKFFGKPLYTETPTSPLEDNE